MNEEILGVLILTFTPLLLGLLLILVSKILRRMIISRVKIQRFEAGNPPLDLPKKKLIMQYFGFIYMTAAIEAVITVIIVLSVLENISTLTLLALMVMIILIPATILAYRYSTKLREWL